MTLVKARTACRVRLVHTACMVANVHVCSTANAPSISERSEQSCIV
jgi:hypothetical protein